MSEWRGTCQVTGKVCFLSRSAAKEVIKRRRNTRTHEVQPFLCAECQYFHIGGKYGMSRTDHRIIHGATVSEPGDMPIEHAAKTLRVSESIVRRMISEGKVRGNDQKVNHTDIQRIKSQILRTP